MKKFIGLIILLYLAFKPHQVQSQEILKYQVTSQKLDSARNNLSTKTGSSSYVFSQADIDNLPQGRTSSLNQILLQAPSITQDSYGQIHIRGDHANIQYRLNDIIIPEGLSGFGQVIDPHFIDQMSLLTGALPAQYGYRTAGVVDIKTKSGGISPQGRTELTTGSYGTMGATQEFSGSHGKFNYYLNANYLQNNLGIESPTPSRKTLHNSTQQNKQFGYFSYLLNPQARISTILANSTNNFQIPNNPDQSPNFNLNGNNNASSANLNENQNEYNRYALIALQGITDDDINYQLATFTRASQMIFRPDYAGDLIFNGIASNINNQSQASGGQGDFSYKINQHNILRSGFFLSADTNSSSMDSAVFSLDNNGNQASLLPINITSKSSQNTQLYGAYLQNEWRVDKLTINYGARFDASKAYVNASQLSPRLGAVYEISSKTKIHAGYARYFTPPATELLTSSALSQFQNTSNAPENLINNKIRPESSNYYDSGIIHKLNSHLNLGLNAYYKDIKNMLDEGRFGQALIYTPFNYQSGKAYGLELTSDYHQEKFSAYFNISTQKSMARNIISSQYLFDADQLNYISNHYVHVDHDQLYTMSGGAAYLYHNTNYSLSALSGSGLRRGFANRQHLPAYLQINAAASRDLNWPIINKFTLRLAMVNLFDQVYLLRDGTGIGVGAPQYGQRRGAYLTLSKKF